MQKHTVLGAKTNLFGCKNHRGLAGLGAKTPPQRCKNGLFECKNQAFWVQNSRVQVQKPRFLRAKTPIFWCKNTSFRCKNRGVCVQKSRCLGAKFYSRPDPLTVPIFGWRGSEEASQAEIPFPDQQLCHPRTCSYFQRWFWRGNSPTTPGLGLSFRDGSEEASHSQRFFQTSDCSKGSCLSSARIVQKRQFKQKWYCTTDCFLKVILSLRRVSGEVIHSDGWLKRLVRRGKTHSDILPDQWWFQRVVS